MDIKRTTRGLVAATLTAAAIVAVPVYAHHSFSIFDASQTKTFTGVVTRVNPDANHLQIFFAPMNEERKNVERDADGKAIVWAVEMAGSAASAQQGISVNEFPPGTVFTVSLHPLRSGDPAGAREGALYKCPTKPPAQPGGRPTGIPPAPGKNCDSVEGMKQIGAGFDPAQQAQQAQQARPSGSN
ncbi:MAG TPA: DUF6152 family protein [Vicinamibacterales bacterium]|nr:DUF6152 family protein [Vicinamibacterales bacterium]